MDTVGFRDSGSVEGRIEDVVFAAMEATPLSKIKASDAIRGAGVSRSTFYRHYKNVGDVISVFEDALLDCLTAINEVAIRACVDGSESDPTPTLVVRLETLRRHRDKVLVLNGPNGDPLFSHKAFLAMHERLRKLVSGLPGDEVAHDMYLTYAVTGYTGVVRSWLETYPYMTATDVADVMCGLIELPPFMGIRDDLA